ncbi:hypothetical protein [Nocardioides piscis]|uniref:hypothetical protein n=1 Tax=Nocardioides piscis TaxID=2714938 RepID=UPI001FEB70C0|nr:hypothetical protein [Nocardioides piscis]
MVDDEPLDVAPQVDGRRYGAQRRRSALRCRSPRLPRADDTAELALAVGDGESNEPR